MLEMKDVSFNYGNGVPVLEHINVEIGEGEFIGLGGVVDTGTLLPIRQLGFRGSFGGGLSRGLGGGLLAAAAGGQAKEHDHRQKTCQPFLCVFVIYLLSNTYRVLTF